MANDTTFVDNLLTAANRIVAAWLNPINNFVWRGSRPTLAVSTGAANVFVLTLPATSLYLAAAAGDTFTFIAHQANNGPATFSVVGAATLTPAAIQANGAALVGNEIVLGGVYSLARVGAVWQMYEQSRPTIPIAQGGTGAVTAVAARLALGFPAVAAKGDWFLGTAANTLGLLTAGANDTFPIADSAQTTGVKWGTVTSFTEDTTPDLTADFALTYDVSAAANKKVLLGRIGAGISRTSQASTSGTIITFSSIPAWVTEICVQFVGVSTNGNSFTIIQLGKAAGIEATGYLSAISVADTAVATTALTTGFGATAGGASSIYHGAVFLTLQDASANTWVASGTLNRSDTPQTMLIAGSKSLAGVLDRVAITMVNGTDAFDAGKLNVLYR